MVVTDAGAPVAAQRAEANPGSRLFRNIAVLAGGQLVTWSLTLLWTLFVPRALGPARMGELTIAYAVTGVVSVAASLGIGTLMVKAIARDHQQVAPLMGSALIVRAGFIVPSILAVALFSQLGHFGREQTLLLWLATASMTIGFFTGTFQSAFQALERMQYLAYADVLNKAVVAFASIVLVLIGFRAVGIMGLGLVMSAVVLVLTIWWSRGKFGIEWGFDRERIRFLVVGSMPYWTNGLVLTFYMWIDSVMLSVMSGDVVVGWYAVATKVFTTLLFVPVILGTALLPRLSAASRDGADAIRQAGRPALELVLVLSVPVAAGAALVAQPFIADIYGASFEPSTWVLVILALTLPATYFNIMASQVLIAANRQLDWTKVMVAAAVVNPLLNLVLIRYFQATQGNGAVGSALSLLATEIGMALVGLFLLPPMLDAKSILRLVRAVAATGGMGLVVWWMSGSGLIIETGAGVFSFAVLALAMRVLTADELALLRKTAAKMATRSAGRSGYGSRQYHGWDDVTGRPVGTYRR